MSPFFLLIIMRAHTVHVLPRDPQGALYTKHTCIAAAERRVRAGFTAYCVRAIEQPHVDLDSEGVKP